MQLTEQYRPGQHFLTVSKLGSGWAAVEMWMNDEEPDLGVFPEPYQTGNGRYSTEEKARQEMLDWQKADPTLEIYIP